MSAEKSSMGDLLRLLAYDSLANLWINLSAKEYDDDLEARSHLQLQEAVVNEFDKTLRRYFDEAAMREFRGYVARHRVGISPPSLDMRHR
jgi:hypothetical protein